MEIWLTEANLEDKKMYNLFLSRHDFLSLYKGTVDKVINVIYTDDYYIFH
jgi:hypothetical protein